MIGAVIVVLVSAIALVYIVARSAGVRFWWLYADPCPKCSGEVQILNERELREMIKSKGGDFFPNLLLLMLQEYGRCLRCGQLFKRGNHL